MSNEKKSVFTDNAVSKDENLPIEQLLAEMREGIESTEPKSEPVNTTVKPEKEEKLSPLEQLKQQRDKVGGGMVVSDKALKEGADSGPKKNIVYNDDRMAAIQGSIDELDESLNKRNYVTVIKKPMDYMQYIQLMDEIESVKLDENGKPYFDLVNDKGEKVIPQFCEIAKEGDDAFDYSVLTEFEKESMKQNGTLPDSVEVSEPSTEDDGDEESSDDISPEKRKIVEILIDKTGLGTDFLFTEEEREKITEAETIRVNEVKLIDINAIKAKRSNKSFQEAVKEYDLGGSRVTICFPASGFKAQMKGLTYGEYADIALSMETVTFDQYYKRLTIIYNKMTNISTGPFEDFEDFLKHFAYTDIPLALYGLFIATEQEKQDIALRCGNSACKKSFNWSYSSRSVLRLDRSADVFLEKMQEIATASAMDYDAIKDASAVNNAKYIELPDSKIICEMGIASSYDFLYNFIPLMNEETFKEAFGNDLNQIYMDNILLLTAIRSVMVPDGEGNYITCEGYKDILDAIYNVAPSEIQILAAYTAKIQSQYNVVFSFGDVVCPHCKNITKNLDITMDDLVFQTYNRLMSTEIDLTKIQDL